MKPNILLALLPLVSRVTFLQKPVTPTVQPVTRFTEPGNPTAKTSSAMLAFLTSGAESHRKLTSLETTLNWRYLSKANLAFRPTSTEGQKALEAALRSAQGTLTIDGRKRVK